MPVERFSDPDEAARALLQRQPLTEGLAALLQCVEPCWTFDTKSSQGRLSIRGEPGKCSATTRQGFTTRASSASTTPERWSRCCR